MPRAVRLGDRDHEHEDAPGQYVPHRGAGHRHGADPGPGEPAVRDDAGQHREGGDGEGRAQEEDEGGRAALRARVPPGEQGRRPGAEQERHGHGESGHGADGPAAAAQPAEIHLPAGQEHEQEQPDLRHGREHRAGVGGEDPAGQVAGQQPEQAGAEHDADGDLRHHRRLADPSAQPDEQPAREQHDGHVGHGDRLCRKPFRRHLPSSRLGAPSWPVAVRLTWVGILPSGRGRRHRPREGKPPSGVQHRWGDREEDAQQKG